nr:unnamed protein product [Callosobruchus analis]
MKMIMAKLIYLFASNAIVDTKVNTKSAYVIPIADRSIDWWSYQVFIRNR